MNKPSECITIPKDEWRELMRELRDFRADHSAMQSRLAKILGGLCEFGRIEQPLNHTDDAKKP